MFKKNTSIKSSNYYKCFFSGFLHTYPARPHSIPVRDPEGDREGVLRPGSQGLRPQDPPARRLEDGKLVIFNLSLILIEIKKKFYSNF